MTSNNFKGTPKNWYVCPTDSCKRIFTSRSGFKTHVRSHHAGQNEEDHHTSLEYTCTQCDKAYKSKTGLDKHVSYHHCNDKVQCEDASCDKAFGSIQAMQAHMLRLHGQSKGMSTLPYVCSFAMCEKRFRRSGNLFRHEQNTHGIWSTVSTKEIPCLTLGTCPASPSTESLSSPAPGSPNISCVSSPTSKDCDMKESQAVSTSIVVDVEPLSPSIVLVEDYLGTLILSNCVLLAENYLELAQEDSTSGISTNYGMIPHAEQKQFHEDVCDASEEMLDGSFLDSVLQTGDDELATAFEDFIVDDQQELLLDEEEWENLFCF